MGGIEGEIPPIPTTTVGMIDPNEGIEGEIPFV